MINGEFTVKRIDFLKRKRTILKTKIIATMKAYTLNEFSVDEKSNVATFKVNISKYGIIKQLPNTYSAYYYTEKVPDSESDIKLKLHISTIGPDLA